MLRYVASTLAFVSQLLHLWVLPGEFEIRPLSGSFVLLAAACQGMLAVSLLFGPGRWTVRLGVLLNMGIVLAWALTRFAGFPPLLGFARLPIEPTNLAATAAEIMLIALLFKIGRGSKTEKGKRRVREKRTWERTGRKGGNG